VINPSKISDNAYILEIEAVKKSPYDEISSIPLLEKEKTGGRT
jgi:hypothetical protein